MWFTVIRSGVPLGTVELSADELSAGLLQPLPAFEGVARTVRLGSAALLGYGLYGPPVSARPDPRRRAAQGALRAAATLQLELVELASGAPVPTVFLNLIEAPGDRGVVVLARFLDSPSRVPAQLARPATTGTNQADAAS